MRWIRVVHPLRLSTPGLFMEPRGTMDAMSPGMKHALRFKTDGLSIEPRHAEAGMATRPGAVARNPLNGNRVGSVSRETIAASDRRSIVVLIVCTASWSFFGSSLDSDAGVLRMLNAS